MASTVTLEMVQQKDADAVKILQTRSVVITVRGPGSNLDEVIYEDRWGNQFRTFIEYK